MKYQFNGREFRMRWAGMTRFVKVSLALLVCSLTISAALGQVRNSTITGTVTDPSGAVVPKAMVSVTDQLTGELSKGQSGAAGDYSIPYLPKGIYTVSIDAPGFQTYSVKDIAVDTGITVQVSAKLTVGATSQVVQVAAQTAQLQTETSSVTESVEAEAITNLPNINDNPLYYATLEAGVVPAAGLYNDENLGVGYENRIGYSEIRVNGGQLGLDDIQLDGVPVQDAGWHSVTVMPNRDALQEVSVATNDLPADLGGGQAVIQMVTKSGTNQFHGDLFYNDRNEQLNANTFSNNLNEAEGAPGSARGKYRVDEAGGSIGGPVLIPHLVNWKNKVFFFASYDRLWNVTPQSFRNTVPTALEATGDYGEAVINANGSPETNTLYNPFSFSSLGGGVYERNPYSASTNCSTYGCGSIISNTDAYGLKYLAAWAGLAAGHYTTPSDPENDGNYSNEGTSPLKRYNFASRMDFHFGNNAFYLSGGIQSGLSSGVNEWGPTSVWQNLSSANVVDDNPYIAVGDTITLNPTTFIDLHAGFQRVGSTNSFSTAGGFTAADYTAYGMPAYEQNLIVPAGFGVAPSVYNLGYEPGNYGYSLNNTQWNWKNTHENNYDFNASITKVIGRWTLKDGVDDRIDQGNWRDVEWMTPSLGAYTDECYCEQYYTEGGNGSSLNTTPQQSGDTQAQGAIGVTGYRFDPGSGIVPALSFKWFSVYTQNDWKATNKLTVNLGLRYEIQPGPTERHNQEYSVDLYAQNPYAQFDLVSGGGNPAATADQDQQAALGLFAFPGTDGYSRNLWNTDLSNISPRIGAAYRLTDKTVIRGGYARIYAPSNNGYNANGTVYGGGEWSGGTEFTPYGQTNYMGTPGGAAAQSVSDPAYGTVHSGRFEDQADTTPLPAPYQNSFGSGQSPYIYGSQNNNAGADNFIRSMRNTYVDQWNLFVERRVGSWLASAGYLGSRGERIPWRLYPLSGTFQIPQTTLQGWRSTWIANDGSPDPAQAQVNNPMPALNGYAAGPIGNGSISVLQSQEGYLGLLNQTVINDTGSSLYHSVELGLKHSYSSGLSAQFSYVWSHATGVSQGADYATYAESQAVSGNTAPGGGFNYQNLQANNGLQGYDIPQRFVAEATYTSQWGSGGKYELSSPISRQLAGGWTLGSVVNVQSGLPWAPSCGGGIDGKCLATGQSLELPKALQGWIYAQPQVNPKTLTLPDGHQYAPGANSYQKWNPDAFAQPVVQFPNGHYAIDQYWNGVTPTYMSALRMPRFVNTNLNITRDFAIREQYKFQLLGEFNNLFNHPNILPGAVSNGVGSITSTSGATYPEAIGENGSTGFGSYGPSTMDPREITLSLKFTF